VQAHTLLEQLRASGRPVGDGVQTARAVTAILDSFSALSVQLLGKFAVATADGPATATVVLAVHPLPVEDPESAAADPAGLAGAVREIIKRRHPLADTRVVSLPAGPTVVGVWSGEFRFPHERTGTEQDVVMPTYRVQFLLPVPATGHLVALDVSTASVHGWPTVARQAVSIAGSMRFDDAG